MGIAITLQEYLDNKDVEYELLEHPSSVSSLETAVLAHVSGNQVAKCIVLHDDLGYVLAVLPASHRLDLETLQDFLQRKLGFAEEYDLAEVFRDCDRGAVPAIGSAYGVLTVVDDSLAEQTEIYLQGGDHESLIRVSTEHFAELTEDSEHTRFSYHM